MPVEQAIDLILAQNQLARQVLSENMVLIYPNTPAKQKDYQDEIVHTFYLTNATPKDVEESAEDGARRQDAVRRRHGQRVVMRDTPEHVRMAEKLVASLDVAEPEVMMEVEVLEIHAAACEQLGINYPTSVSATLGNARAATGLALSDLRQAERHHHHRLPLSRSASTGVRDRRRHQRAVEPADPGAQQGEGQDPGRQPRAGGDLRHERHGRRLVLDQQRAVHRGGPDAGGRSRPSTDGNVAIKVALEVSSIINHDRNGGTTLAYQIGTRNATRCLRAQGRRDARCSAG